MKKFIKIVEVGPRDGLQNEKQVLTVDKKVSLIEKLAHTGLSYIEVGSFVSPKWVPQMADTDQVWKTLCQKGLTSHVAYSCLVPNEIGFNKALDLGFKEVAIFGSCSETFSQKNINCTIEESFKKFEIITKKAQEKQIRVRGYLSMAFGSPYEKEISPETVISLTQKMLALGVYEVSLGDTLSVASPEKVKALFSKMKSKVDVEKIALHFHDTQNKALDNVVAGLEEGVGVFDSSISGLGGCPYAQSSIGNLATEKLVQKLHDLGYETKINLERLLEVKTWVQKGQFFAS